MIDKQFGYGKSFDYIQKYIEFLQRYKYFVGGIVYSDYYSFDLTKSTVSDLNQGGTYEPIGENSSIKYTKVISYPLFFRSNYQLSTTGEQFGLISQTQMDVIFISLDEPYTFVPTTYDLVVVRYGDENSNLLPLLPVYRVANVQVLPIYTTNNLYKITLIASNYVYKDLLKYEQYQVSKTLVFDDFTSSFYEVEKFVIISYLRNIKEKFVNELQNTRRDFKYKVVILEPYVNFGVGDTNPQLKELEQIYQYYLSEYGDDSELPEH